MKKVFGRILIVLPAIALEVAWYVLIVMFLNRLLGGHLGEVLQLLFSVLAIIFIAILISKRDESSYKILWVMIIAAFPVVGAMLYFFLGNKSTGKKLKEKLTKSDQNLPPLTGKVEIVKRNVSAIENEDKRIGQTLGFVTESTGFPLLKNRTSKYYPFGEDMFKDMCEDLKKAEKFIYVEYFIIQSGKFWDTLTDILAEKAAAGVDVRVVYDDLGSIATYSAKDIKFLADKGIKCIAFNPFFLIKTQLNNRDHRKIMVIDGKVAYSGGVNLADEYINETHPFGRWKDIGFRLTGPAVVSYYFMFVEFWNAFSKDDEIPLEAQKAALKTFEELDKSDKKRGERPENGFILPYYDSPMRDEHTSNILFTEILSMATDYVWFYTPYLMLGDALYDAFIRAARRGVDVRIIMPGIPDKKMVFRLSRSYYEDLLKAGVKIYEYTPGFVHAKAVLSDDKIAGIGTVNLDYRSLFLHFECNSVFYKADIVDDLKRDYLESQEECREITLDSLNHGVLHKFGDDMLRMIAPLL